MFVPRTATATAALVLACATATAQSPASPPAPADLARRVDSIFARYARNDAPGCAVGLGRDGRMLYTRGYGSANLEYRVPITDSTIFESGSVAKQFTAAALVLLAQDGKLSLDDDVRKWIPEVPEFGERITIRHLLNHTSGLRDQWGLLGIMGRSPGTQVHSAATTVDLIAHQKMLNFPVGTAHLYSNSGYTLAGVIVERASGMSLDRFSQERLFKPLGMANTQWRDDFTEVVPGRATAYSGNAQNGFRMDMSFTNIVGNGGLLTTVHDLLRWNENLQNPTVGGRAMVEAMETVGVLRNGRKISYALGLTVGSRDGIREVSHGGSTAGYRTFLARYPEQRVSVAILCNDAGANPTTLANQVADLVLVKSRTVTAAATPAGEPAVNLSPAAIAAVAGTYRAVMTGQLIAFEVMDGKLTWTGARPTPLVPVSGQQFRTSSGPARRFVFGTPVAARPGTLEVIAGDGDTTRYERVEPAPAQIPVRDYLGRYVSDELDVVLEVVERNGALAIRRRPSTTIALRPAYRDGFESGGLGSVRFTRDASGAVTGFAIFQGRVLDVRFRKDVK